MDQEYTTNDLPKRLLRYVPMAIVLLAVFAALVWFFWLRSPSKDDTITTTGTQSEPAKTPTSTPANAPDTKTGSPSTGLPNSGPADTFAIAAASALAGALLWEWRLRRQTGRS